MGKLEREEEQSTEVEGARINVNYHKRSYWENVGEREELTH